MKKLAALLSLLLISLSTQAAPPTEESIDKLLSVTHAEKMVDTVKAQLQPMMKGMEQQAMDGKTLSAADQKILDKFHTRVIDIMNENMTMEKLRPLYVRIYSQTFSQEEIDNLIAFYESPTGQTFVTKMPLVMQSVMSEMPKLMAPMLQEMQKASKDMNDEITAAHKQGAK